MERKRYFIFVIGKAVPGQESYFKFIHSIALPGTNSCGIFTNIFFTAVDGKAMKGSLGVIILLSMSTYYSQGFILNSGSTSVGHAQ